MAINLMTSVFGPGSAGADAGAAAVAIGGVADKLDRDSGLSDVLPGEELRVARITVALAAAKPTASTKETRRRIASESYHFSFV